MSVVQYIEKDGRREYAIVPIALFEQLIEYAEDLEDIALLDEFRRTDDGFRVPGEVVDAMFDEGAHPVKAWRDHRGLTQDSLAAAAGISKAYLCQIETGKRTGAVKTLRALARALEVPLDMLER
jgi:DNA-binding XRE family transcriptional regulator